MRSLFILVSLLFTILINYVIKSVNICIEFNYTLRKYQHLIARNKNDSTTLNHWLVQSNRGVKIAETKLVTDAYVKF